MTGKENFILIVVSIPLIILSGFIIKIMWGWYMVPLGVPPVTVAHAIGIDILVTYILGSSKMNLDRTLGEIITDVVGKKLIFLLLAWIVHFFM